MKQSVETVLHVRRVPAQLPSCKDGNEGHREVFATLNDREVSKAEACLRVERRGDCMIEALTATMFSDDLM